MNRAIREEHWHKTAVSAGKACQRVLGVVFQVVWLRPDDRVVLCTINNKDGIGRTVRNVSRETEPERGGLAR